MCLWLGCVVHSFSQINVSFDSNCLSYNSAIMSNTMIGIFGPDTVRRFLDCNTNVILFCRVDSSGKVLEIVKIRSRQHLPINFIPLVENYLISKKVRFFICFEKVPSNISISEVIESERKQFMNNPNRFIRPIAFPGELMSLYEYEKECAKAKGFYLSKYDYLLEQINKYLTESDY